jgi:hypoxanthine phosphoribosyltransferase
MLTPSTVPLFTEKEISDRVDAMGAEIVKDMCQNGPITVVGLLRGCFVFMADLVRAISRHGGLVSETDFLIVTSYGSGTTSSGNLKIERDIKHDIKGKNILLLDDILDTGNTLNRISNLLKERKPAGLKTVVLLDKPARRRVQIDADFTGFAIEDRFVIGYGLDYDQKYRELPYVSEMLESD